jgi:DNA-binding response OmpR family regulator
MTEPSSTFTIAVVDDSPAIRLATSRLLRKEGYTVVEAASGTEGAALIREIRPDLVLMDVNLGDADGRDLCKTLKKEPEMERLFFVLISNVMTSSEDQVRGLDDGADGYITRPIENRELRAGINAFKRIAAGERKLGETIERLQISEAKNNVHIAELEFFTKMAVGRELRMLELKEEINSLYSQLGKQGPYPLADPAGTAEPPHRPPESLGR